MLIVMIHYYNKYALFIQIIFDCHFKMRVNLLYNQENAFENKGAHEILIYFIAQQVMI